MITSAPNVLSRPPLGASPVNARPGRVLVIDDEPLVARATSRLLAASGHDVTVCTNPTQALEALLGGMRFDAILCDVVMPGLSGPALLAALESERPDQARRLAFVTGGSPDPAHERFLRRASNPCMHKPYGPHELLALVDSIIEAG